MDSLVRSYNRAGEKTRATLWKQHGAELGQYINQDGTRIETALAEGAQPITRAAVTSGAVSPSLMVRANEVANTAHSVGATIATELDSAKGQMARDMQVLLRGVGFKGGSPLHLAVVEGLPSTHQAFIKDDVLYISQEALGNIDVAAQKFFHENAHFARGSKWYNSFAETFDDCLKTGDKGINDMVHQAVDAVRAATVQHGVENGYNISDEVLDRILGGDLSLSATKLNAEEELAIDEVMARIYEYTFGNEATMRALVEQNRTTMRKWLDRIKMTIARAEAWAKTRKGTEEQRAAAHQALNGLKTLRNARKMLTDILAESGQRYIAQRAIEAIRGKDSNKAGEETIKFSLMNNHSFEENVSQVIAMSDDEARRNIEEANFVSVMRDTPSVILENVSGAENIEIVIAFKNLYLAVRQDGVIPKTDGHYHDLGELAKNSQDISKTLMQLLRQVKDISICLLPLTARMADTILYLSC